MDDSVFAARYRRLRDELGPDHLETVTAHGARTAEVLCAESDAPAPEGTLWWLSFVDPDRAAPPGQQVPGGPGFLGVAVVAACGPVTAVYRAGELGINPGGEVRMYPARAEDVPAEFRDRLLTFAEALPLSALGDPNDETEEDER
jgi:hypothetical protein